MRRFGWGVAALALAMSWSGAADAYDKELVAPVGWRYEVQPYGFLPINITGDATVGDRSVPVDVSIGDVVDKLKFAAELRFEAWNGPWGLIFDGIYVSLGDSKSRADLTFDLSAKMWLGAAMGAYRIELVRPAPGKPSLVLDVMVGGQVTRLSQSLDIEMRSLSESRDAAKALGEVRAVYRLNPSWAFIARATVAGPDFMFTAGGAAEWDVSRLALRLGYGYMMLDESSARLKLDVSTHGPFVAMGIRFGTGPTF